MDPKKILLATCDFKDGIDTLENFGVKFDVNGYGVLIFDRPEEWDRARQFLDGIGASFIEVELKEECAR